MNRWWLSKGFVWTLIVVLGPVGLPFLWFSPFFTRKTKIWLTVTTVILAVLMARFTVLLVQFLEKELASLRQVQAGL
ncbi:MAG TPA: hypothetical protein VL404_04595 [Candidatus Eisenbacteria bacterium]|jgi:hypothetical protein|nr:hypothetical protein [Candidatus Eisenbacteria bacterium]